MDLLWLKLTLIEISVLSKYIVCICYVDDCLLFTHKQEKLHELLKWLKDDGDKYNWKLRVIQC